MKAHELVELLIQRDGRSLTEVAKDMGGRNFQGTLWKFSKGEVKSPRHETVARIASYFKLPVEVFYNPLLAEKVASERGLLVKPLLASEPAPQLSGGEVVRLRKANPGLSDALLGRIRTLNAQQLQALEAMIVSYLDTIAPPHGKRVPSRGPQT